jgi:hypothetical protein
MYSLQNTLKQKVKEGELWERLDEKRIRCYACGHCCPIPEGHVGVCKVRFNRGGKLLVPWGYVGGVQCDPIEKKPFFHAYPGALAYSFGMLGCDLHCGYCQNWVTSQALRDPAAVAPPRRATPQALARAVVRDVVELPEQPCSAFEPWLTRGDHPVEALGRCTGHAAGHGAFPISTRSFRMAGPSNSNNSTTSPKTPVPGLRFNPLSLLSHKVSNKAA